MANSRSARKRIRSSERKHVRNRAVKSAVRTKVIKARHALLEEGSATGEAELHAAIKALDRAAEKGILHRNNVRRRKSRLATMAAASRTWQRAAREPRLVPPRPAVPRVGAPSSRPRRPRRSRGKTRRQGTCAEGECGESHRSEGRSAEGAPSGPPPSRRPRPPRPNRSGRGFYPGLRRSRLRQVGGSPQDRKPNAVRV